MVVEYLRVLFQPCSPLCISQKQDVNGLLTKEEKEKQRIAKKSDELEKKTQFKIAAIVSAGRELVLEFKNPKTTGTRKIQILKLNKDLQIRLQKEQEKLDRLIQSRDNIEQTEDTLDLVAIQRDYHNQTKQVLAKHKIKPGEIEKILEDNEEIADTMASVQELTDVLGQPLLTGDGTVSTSAVRKNLAGISSEYLSNDDLTEEIDLTDDSQFNWISDTDAIVTTTTSTIPPAYSSPYSYPPIPSFSTPVSNSHIPSATPPIRPITNVHNQYYATPSSSPVPYLIPN